MAVYMFLADGFEEVEALLPADFFNRAGIEVKLVRVGGSNFSSIDGGQKIRVHPPYSLDEVTMSDAELLYLPGGMVGVKNLTANSTLANIINAQLLVKKYVAAICAAPAHVLGVKGMLKGKNYTGYPGTETVVKDGNYITDQAIVQDENIITSQGVGTAAQFAYYLIRLLRNERTADKVWHETLCDKFLIKP